MMFFFAILGIYILEAIFKIKFKKDTKIFTSFIKQIVPFFIVIALVGWWYHYAGSYNRLHNEGIFLVGILPVWQYSTQEILLGLKTLWSGMMVDQFFNIETLFLILIFLILQLYSIKKTNYFLFSITIFLLIELVIYISLWFGALFGRHDYYLTNLLIFVVFAFISFFMFLKEHYKNIYYSKWLKVAMSLILCYNVYLTSAKTAVKYFKSAQNYPRCYSSEEAEFIGDIKYYSSDHKEPLQKLSKVFDSLGIKPTDKVISIPDASFDISLYFIDRKGWTDFDSPQPRTAQWFLDKIKKGAKYLIISDSYVFNDTAIIPFTRNLIYKNKEVYIYNITTPVRGINIEKTYDFESGNAFGNAQLVVKSDSSNSSNHFSIVTPTDEFGVIIKNTNKEMAPLVGINEISVESELFSEKSPVDLYWVFQINNKQDSMLSRAQLKIDFSDFKTNSWNKHESKLFLPDFRLPKESTLNIYLWNVGKNNSKIDDVKIKIKGYM